MEDHEVKEETEVALDVNDNKKKKKSKKDKKKEPEPRVPLKELFRYATGVDYALMFFGSLGGIAQGAIMPSFALVFGLVLDAFNDMGPGFLDRVLEVALYFLYAGIGALFVTYAQTGFWNWTSARQNNVIRNEYLKAILRQEVAWFDQTPSGELTTRIVSDTIIIQEAMGEKIGTFLQYMSTGITGFILGFTKSWKLSLVMFAVTPLLAACGAFMVKILAQITTRGQKEYAKAGAFASETISGVRTIASFASEPIAADKYKVSLTEAKNLGIRGGLVSGVGIGVTLFVFFGVYGLALWYGSTLVADGEISGGDVLTVFFSVLLGAFALGQASPSMEALAKGQGAAYKIFTTIDRQTAIDPSLQTGERLEKVIGNIKFSDVCFTYPNRAEHTVFRGLNIDIKAGEKVAFVGHSGSGKSTTIQMILRFYDPDAGTVTLDGQNIKDFNLYWYRNQIGLVGQEPVLFTGTIAENIAYGKPGATQEEIEEAAKMSNAHKFIQTFPDGYNTQVGEKGAQLSGGQKQRIAIARAIIKNPKILLLDEATSALDTESEKVVQDALDSVMGGRTTIIVAHRLATIRDANKILVISKGVVAEQGNHDELMDKKGLYYDLVQSQTGGVTYEKKEKKKQNDEKKVETETEAQKTEVDESSVDIKSVKFSRILALNKPEAKFLVMGCIAAAFNGAVQPVFSILFSEMVALFYMPPDVIRADSWKWAIGFAAIGFVPLTCYIVQSYSFAVAGQRLIEKLRDICFRAILRHDVGWFDRTENSTGALTSRLASEATLVETAVGPRLGILSQNISMVLVGLIIAFIYGWKLTLVVLATSPLLAFSNAMQMQTMKNYTEKLRKANESGNQIAQEAIMNIRTVYAFTHEDFVYNRYKERMARPARVQLVNAHIKGLLLGIGQLVTLGSFTLSFWYGAKLITLGEYNFEQVMKVFMAVIMIATGVGQAAGLAPDSSKALRAAGVIFGIVDDVPVIDSYATDGITKEDGLQGNIDLVDVAFKYPTRPDTQILKGMNLSIKKGQVVALVGHSGCGKSSTVSLLERYYDANEGSVKIDGVDVKDYNLRWLRQQIGLVGQEPILFSGTIAENIAYGKPGSSQEEIENAAKAANAHNFILTFPDGYNTQVGEKGAQLSGGQKQRIAIARAIIKNPQILLLDEATSALDAESEKIVQAALDSVMKGRTTLIIAHRLTTIRNADMICVIENGSVKEQGTHDELMKLEGAYYNLVIRQTA